MPFKQRFERRVNENMREGLQAGRAPRVSEDHDMDLKKGFGPPPEENDRDEEALDEEMHDQKDRPPRFSTIFGAAPRVPASPPTPIQYMERPPRRRSGVFMPMPLFILFVVIIFFESTILFAYTILGIYNNAGPRLFGLAGPNNCPTNTQPFVNISPNFVLPQIPQPVTVNPWLGGNAAGMIPDMVTVKNIDPTTSTMSTSSTISTTTSSSSSSSATSSTSSTSSSTSTTSTSTDSTSTLGTTSTVSTSDTTSGTSTSDSASTTSASATSSSSTSTTSTVALTGLTVSVTSSNSVPVVTSTGATVIVTAPPAPMVTVTSIAIASPSS